MMLHNSKINIENENEIIRKSSINISKNIDIIVELFRNSCIKISIIKKNNFWFDEKMFYGSLSYRKSSEHGHPYYVIGLKEKMDLFSIVLMSIDDNLSYDYIHTFIFNKINEAITRMLKSKSNYILPVNQLYK